ncbi:DUF5309 family protein [Candidatus Pacearchaeota archaeon]|nr:DUF5309 family protein [Candidatus Pacearchaeota archaeon]
MAQYPYYTEPTHDQGTVAAAPRTTAVSEAEGRMIVNVVDKIFLLEPNKHPLVTLLTNVGKVYDGKAWKGSSMLKKATGNPEFGWFEDYYGGRYAKNVGAIAAGGVTLTVSGAGSSSAHIFTKGDLVKNARTNEIMFVSAVASTTTITVTRSFGTTAAAALVDGDGLYIVGNVSEENASARNVNTTRSAKQTNYTQIFKTTIAVSDTEKNAELYGGADLPYLRAKKATEHALDIERAFWWGEKASTTGTNGHPKRATGGVQEFIESGNSYVQNQGGVLTAPDFNTFLREAFTYGDNTKTLFSGGIVLQALNEIARGQILMKPIQKAYGMKISEWVTPFGSINIVHHSLFVEDYAGYAYLLDMQCFKYRFMNNRDTRLLTNVQAPDVDGQIDQYITECGLQRMQAPRHALLKGVTA